MSEPLTNERLEQIRGWVDARRPSISWQTWDAMVELLAEVDRLRTPRGLTEEDRKKLERITVRVERAEKQDHGNRDVLMLRWMIDLVSRLRSELEAHAAMIHDLKEESLAYRLGYKQGSAAGYIEAKTTP